MEPVVKYLCLLGLLALLAVGNAAADFDYCTIKCEQVAEPHTCCTYKTEKPGENCKDYVDRLLTKEDKQGILDKHNDLRGQVARGEIEGQPAAKNMQALVWSSELEMIARRWALQCTFKHDQCRSTKDGLAAGQNLAIKVATGKSDFQLELTQDWFDEHKLYTPTNDGAFTFDLTTGHYTQLVWAKTSYLGCERTTFTESHPGTEFLVCVYSPAGNYAGEPVYLVEESGKGTLQPGAEPRPGESGIPGNGATSVGHLESLTLSVCLFIALKSAILSSWF